VRLAGASSRVFTVAPFTGITRGPPGGGRSRAFPALARDSAYGQKQAVIGVTWPVTTLLKYVTLSGGL